LNNHTVLLDNKAVLLDNKAVLSDNTTVLSDNHTMLLDIHRNVLAGQEGTIDQHQSVRLYTVHSTTATDSFSDSSQVSGCKR
jgi:hypothetical protein